MTVMMMYDMYAVFIDHYGHTETIPLVVLSITTDFRTVKGYLSVHYMFTLFCI